MEIDPGVSPLLDLPWYNGRNFNLDEKLKISSMLDWYYPDDVHPEFLLDEMSVTFNCHGNEMQLNGPATIWCTKDGNYSAAPPTCQKRQGKFILKCLFYSLKRICILPNPGLRTISHTLIYHPQLTIIRKN